MTTDKKEEKVNEFIVAQRLAKKYPQPAYAFITRVRNQTGYGVKELRTADAIAMSLWPSRGLGIQGFEIKVSRADWLKELSDPAKADEMQQFCNYWWLVVHDAKIVNLSELPHTWGLIVAGKNGNKVVKDAPFQKAKDIDYQLLAGILRNVTENFIHKDCIAEKIDEAKTSWERNSEYELKDLKKKMERLNLFTEASGVNPLDGWDREKKIGEAVKIVLNMKSELEWKFKDIHSYFLQSIEKFEAAGNELKGILKVKANEV